MALPIREICEICHGDGVIPTAVDGGGNPTDYIDCSACESTGDNLWGSLEMPTNVFESYIVLEEIDTTEYNGLTDAQKEGVKILLSCGKVDLNEGKAGRVRLWSWFGAESTTVANLIALLEI